MRVAELAAVETILLDIGHIIGIPLGGDDETLTRIVLVAEPDADSAEERTAQGERGMEVVETRYAEESYAGDDVPGA